MISLDIRVQAGNMQIYKGSLALVLLLSAVAVVQARRVIRAAPGVETTGRYIVVLKNETSHDKFETIADEVRNESLNAAIFEKIEGPFAKIVTAELSEDGAHKVKDFDNVEFVEEETYAYISISWALDRIDQTSSVLDNKFNPYGNGEGTDVYILDTGINYDHSEFGGRAKYPGYDPNDVRNKENQKGKDCDGHGTHVASLAVGKEYGAAKKAIAYSVRVLGCTGSAPWSVVIDGLNYAANKIDNSNRPGVISMSLGGSYSKSVDTALTNVVNRGIIVVVAAGNDRDDACKYSPASTSGVITVAGSANGDNVYYYSNGGTCVDVFAPGASVLGADYRCNTCAITYSGTSMATPIVSGVVAIHLQKQPNLTPAQITQKLVQESLKNKLNYNSLANKVRSNTANRLLHVGAAPATTSTVTSTKTVTSISTSTTTVRETVTSTTTKTLVSTTFITSTTSLTSYVTSTVTSIFRTTELVTSTLTSTIERTTTLTTPGPTQTQTTTATKTVTNVFIPTPAPCSIQPSQPIPTTIPATITCCADLLQYGSATSGEYLIKTEEGEKSVYCELEKDIKGNKGFMRVAYLNMSVPGTKCPGDLTLRQDGSLKTCQRSQNNPGCSSAFFSTSNFKYSKVCGRVRGYQWSTPNAFYWFQRNPYYTIDDLYVDGVVLTYKNNSKRHHIWTFAGAIDPVGRFISFSCQCTNKDVTSSFFTPSFVGEDYFCETGAKDTYRYNTLYTDDPLWDGQGCTEKDICCDRGQWFCKDVPKTNSDIELRLCGNENRHNEDTPLEIIELYVQ